jgi:excisionase family DNA binding protein
VSRATSRAPFPAVEDAERGDDARLVVTLTLGELRSALQDAITEAVAELAPTAGPVLLTGAQLAQTLGVSRATVHRLRVSGCPSIKLGDTFRFELEAVLAWLRTREDDS